MDGYYQPVYVTLLVIDFLKKANLGTPIDWLKKNVNNETMFEICMNNKYICYFINAFISICV